MPTKLIACAFVVTIAYLIILGHVDSASIRRKRRKDGPSVNTSGNSTESAERLKVDNQSALFSDRAGARIVSKRLAAAVASDIASQNNSVAQNKSIKIQNNTHQSKKLPAGDVLVKPNANADSDNDDNNGAGAGLENAEHFENVGLKNVIENVMDQNLNGKVSKEKRKEINQEALKFKLNENDGKKFQKHLVQSKEISKPSHPHPAGQTTSLAPLKMEELQLPDHVDGLRMEHDGHLNREYKKEILLGNHEEFEWESESKLVDRLKDIFKRADKNQDDNIDLDELQSWIMFNVQNHLDEAVADNKRIFGHLDSNNDGFVTWKEFYIHFMLAKGHDVDSANKQSNDYDTISLDPDEKEKIIRYKFRWAEADEDPQDNRLTFDEFMNFRHPEQSQALLVRMVKDLIHNLDRNGDDVITEEEFMMSSDDGHESSESDKRWLTERKKEFREVIDTNKDGIIDEAELKVYVNPHNANLAKLEAENLIRLADQDADGLLSLGEMLENAELFLGSKVVDASRNFHDEF